MAEPTMSYPFYVDPNRSYYNQTAQLLRAQFSDWQNFFQPIELQAMQQISFENPKVLTQAVEEAEQGASGIFDTMSGVMERQNRSLGIEPTAKESQTSKRLIDLDRALAVASAANQARQNVRSMDEQILFGQLPANQNIAKMGTA